MDVESLILRLLGTVDIVTGFNLQVVLGMFFVTLAGEVNIQVPLLMESVLLAIGYQAGTYTSQTSVSNLVTALIATQAGRQLGMVSLFYLFPLLNRPLSRVYIKPVKWIQQNRFYKRYVKRYFENEYFHDLKFLSIGSSTVGMLTWLNSPIKVMLIFKRRLRILLLATFLSGMIFDAVYVMLGAVFHVTTLKVSYLPVFLAVGILWFSIMRWKIAR